MPRVLGLWLILLGGWFGCYGSRGSDRDCSAACEQRVDAIVGKMTAEEKMDYVGGTDGFYIRAVPRLHLPAFRMSDGPFGVRGREPSTLYAAGISLAASWDVQLAEEVGAAIGRDARARGIHMMLGPGVNIYRSPLNGRNFEFFGEDPHLAGKIGAGYVRGMQAEGVSAVVKHFAVSSSEFDRHHANDVIDERALHEIYLRPFEIVVRESNPGAVMDAYGITNGVHMTENASLNSTVLKHDWGFQGLIMSDWRATYDGVAAANGGLDLEMPSGSLMSRSTLEAALHSGAVSMRTIDDKVRRIVRVAVRLGWLDRAAVDISIPLYDPQNANVALQSAREGAVLLKNNYALLPLDKTVVKSVLVVGPNAYPSVDVGGGSAAFRPYAPSSLLQGLGALLKGRASVYYAHGLPTTGDTANSTDFYIDEVGSASGLRSETFANAQLSGTPVETHIDQHVNYDGTLPEDIVNVDFGRALAPQPMGTRWVGYYIPKETGEYEVFVQGGGFESKYRLFVDGRLVFDCWEGVRAVLSQVRFPLSASAHKIVLETFRPVPFGGLRLRLGIAKAGSLVDSATTVLAQRADVVVVAVGFNREIERETGDRMFDLPVGQDELIQRMVSANPKTVVVVESGGSVNLNSWVDRVPALIEGWYSGQAGGEAMAEILFGETNPSGHLPVTFERRLEDNPTLSGDAAGLRENGTVYKEGVFVGYRGLENKGIGARFPFGFGLSYTTFAFGDLRVARTSEKDPWSVAVTFSVTNTGARSGSEVAEVYVASPHARLPRPPKELKAFERIRLQAGESQRVTINLDKRAFSYFDPGTDQWRVDPGDFTVLVGDSSDNTVLTGSVNVPSASR